MGNDKVTMIYRVTAIYRSTLQKNIRQLKMFWKLYGDCDIEGDRSYKAVNLYRFDCIIYFEVLRP